MNFIGWIKLAVTTAIKVLPFFSGDKPSLSEAIPDVFAKMLPVIRDGIKYGQLNTKQKLDVWLDTLDQGTGTDPDAIDIIRTLPADKEETMFDHLKEAARIYGYNLLKEAGYYTEAA